MIFPHTLHSNLLAIANMTRLPGIGLAIAHYLLRLPESHNVIAVARSEAPLATLQSQYPKQVRFVAGDLADFSLGQKAVDLAIKEYGQLDGLVVNHGILEPVTRVRDSEAEEWRKNFDVNFFSAIAIVGLA